MMLRSRIIPVLLMRDKGLVKTRQFKDPKYVGDPINAVKIFNEKEVDELLIFDIDASRTGRPPDMDHLRKIAVESRMPLAYGGGVTSASQASEIISLGFEKVSLSTAALKNPALVSETVRTIGSQSVVVTLDVRKHRIGRGYSVMTQNGTKELKISLRDAVSMATESGAGEIIINSVDREGSLSGYDLALARQIREQVTVPVTFAGGAGNVAHMQELISTVGVVGVGVGSLFVFKGPYRAVLISYVRPN